MQQNINWLLGMNFDVSYLRYCQAMGYKPSSNGAAQYELRSRHGMDCNGIDFGTVDIDVFVQQFNVEKISRGFVIDKDNDAWPMFVTILVRGWAFEDRVAAWLTSSGHVIKKGERWIRYHTKFKKEFSFMGDLCWVWGKEPSMNDTLEVKAAKRFTSFHDWPGDSIVVNRDFKAKPTGKVKAIYHIHVSSDCRCAMFIHRDTSALWYLDNKSNYDAYGKGNVVYKMDIKDANRHPGVFIASMCQPIELPRIMPMF